MSSADGYRGEKISFDRAISMAGETLGELPVICKPVPKKFGTSEWSQTVGLNRQDKAAVIEEVSGIVANAGSIVIAEYRGLSVQAVTQLRANARKEGTARA